MIQRPLVLSIHCYHKSRMPVQWKRQHWACFLMGLLEGIRCLAKAFLRIDAPYVGNWNSRCFTFRSLYQVDRYMRAPGFVLYPYVFVAGPNKHDCSRRTRQRGKF
jgi:hypothetical protein